MKIRYKILGLFTVLLLVLIVNTCETNAAGSFSVSGGGTVSAGEKKTITITSTGVGRFDLTISGGGSLSTSSVSVGSYGGSTTVTVTAPASGSATVSVTASDVTNEDESALTGTKSVTLTVKTETSTGSSSSSSSSSGSSSSGSSSSGSTTTTETKSSDNKLSALSVSDGTLSPEFASGTTEYTVNVMDIDTITISATKSDSDATLSGTGEKELEPGENVFEVVVKAENGSTKTYSITVNMAETPTAYVTLDGVELGVVKDTSEVVAPDGFEETTATVDGEEVVAWTSNILGMTVLYMTDADGVEGFYLYDEAAGTLAEFRPLGLLGKNVYIVDIAQEDQAREGMVYQSVVVDGNTMYGWAFEDESLADYYVIYVLSDSGQMVSYLYCVSDNSMITAPDMAPVSSESYESVMAALTDNTEALQASEAENAEQSQLLTYVEYFALGAMILSIILLIIMIVLIVKLKKASRRKPAVYGDVVGADAFLDDDMDEDLGIDIDINVDESLDVELEEFGDEL